MKLKRLRRAVQVSIEEDERGESEPVSDVSAFLDEIEAEVMEPARSGNAKDHR
jgi:hypothetical protein